MTETKERRLNDTEGEFSMWRNIGSELLRGGSEKDSVLVVYVKRVRVSDRMEEMSVWGCSMTIS